MANIKYVSSRGVEFNLLSFESAKLKDANFHKIEWIPETIVKQFGVTISRFTKNPQIFDCTFKFRGSPSNRKTLIDAFMYECEYDLAHQSAGRLYWNSQYIDCFFNTSDTHPDGYYTEIKGSFYCPYPNWTEEQTLIIRPSDATEEGIPDYAKRYNPAYPYPYGYAYAKTATFFSINSPLDCNFKAVIYGATPSVSFNISGNTYTVNHSLRVGQIMVIDSRDTTPIEDKCYILNENGTKTNVFDYRDPSTSLFKKIPSGNGVFNYPRTYGIDLTIFQERSAPI